MKIAKSLIESIGVYLPPKRVTTAEVLAGCVYPLRIPLERLTGIKVRHCAGDTEFSIDLAAKAVEDCLQRSHAAADEIDLLICANISRFDGPREVSYEPTTSIKLKKRFGFRRAIALDISNACAGMWTAIYIVDAMIRAGSIQRGMVVSGEYISYLTDTAQREIAAQIDPQLASLTLGDAGLAVILEASPRPEVGFHDIELYTLSKYSRFCIAKPTDRDHGGAAMHTDAIKVTAAVVPHAATHAEFILGRNGRPLTDVDHIIPHQTSKRTMEGAIDEMKRRFNHDFSPRLVNNLEQRGNTATTSHLLALRDSILQQKIRSGDDILFSISGSGQTTGTALYTCDDLPERLRSNTVTQNGNGHRPANWGETLPVPMCLEAIGTAAPEAGERADTLSMLQTAARQCLKSSRFTKKQIGMLLFAGVYRTDFVTEPAIAALLAGDLKMNDFCSPDAPHKTLALDVFNGAVGFLNSCYLVSELARRMCPTGDDRDGRSREQCRRGSRSLARPVRDGFRRAASGIGRRRNRFPGVLVRLLPGARRCPARARDLERTWPPVPGRVPRSALAADLPGLHRTERVAISGPAEGSAGGDPGLAAAANQSLVRRGHSTATGLGWLARRQRGIAVRRPVHLLDPDRHASSA